MMFYFKIGSLIEIFIFPEILMKMLNCSKLDHIDWPTVSVGFINSTGVGKWERKENKICML